jgi:hypothetical protein
MSLQSNTHAITCGDNAYSTIAYDGRRRRSTSAFAELFAVACWALFCYRLPFTPYSITDAISTTVCISSLAGFIWGVLQGAEESRIHRFINDSIQLICKWIVICVRKRSMSSSLNHHHSTHHSLVGVQPVAVPSKPVLSFLNSSPLHSFEMSACTLNGHDCYAEHDTLFPHSQL